MKHTRKIGRIFGFMAGVTCLIVLVYKVLFLDYIARHQNLVKKQSETSKAQRNFFDVAIDQGEVVELSLYLVTGIGGFILAFIRSRPKGEG